MTNDPDIQKGQSNPEFLWVRYTETAISEFNSDRFSAAAENWQSAHRMTRDFDDRDPRLAGSLNNLALAFRIKHDFDEAERIYRSALQNWESAARWVDTMQLRQRARSSLFHLRLERKHRKKYDNAVRRKYQKLLVAGQAGTLNNLAELFLSTNRVKEAERYYHQALRRRADSMDEQESGVAIINTNLASLSDTFNKPPDKTLRAAQKSKDPAGFISRAEQQGWVVDNPSEFTDEGRLMAAIFLTYLVDHTRVKPLRPESNR
jgi:tetratricopeptide (TPR) repeat protein